MATADELYGKGNEAFVAEQYESAVELYTKAIDLNDSNTDFYANRAHAYLKLEKYSDVVSDADKSLNLSANQAKLHLWKGIARFNLGEYDEALSSFESGQSIQDDSKFANWICKCEEKIKQIELSEVPAPVPVVSKIRHDWYQTELYVILTILVKNALQENVRIAFTNNTVKCKVVLPGHDDYELDLNLAHSVDANNCTLKVFASKIEVKLKKLTGLQWTKLEAPLVKEPEIKQFVPDKPTVQTCIYPSSCAKKKDWDKIAVNISKEEPDEGAEGEAAVNQLFQKIYSEGSDEVKKAMNKSFTESGGTVLSTNWGDVGKKTTDVKAPDGMEWKKWEA